MSDVPDLERITFFPGQRLLASDLGDMQRTDRELRWLHNRSLHTWGIGIGLGVTGEAGDTAVTIAPGYGIDCLGREIILGDTRVKPIPAVAGDQGSPVEFFLVAAYQDDDQQAVEERRPGVCLPEGTVRLGEEPLLAWKKRDALDPGQELVLAQVLIQNCRLTQPVSLAVRRSARPSSAPYIAAGQTGAGATPWTALQIAGAIIGVTVDVDTSSARFRTTPRYVAHVVGERLVPQTPAPILVLGFPLVSGATPERFTMGVLLPDLGADYNPPSLRSASGADFVRDTLAWRVVWMGVEG